MLTHEEKEELLCHIPNGGGQAIIDRFAALEAECRFAGIARRAIDLNELFFRETMKRMNVGASALTGDDITNWNEAAVATKKAWLTAHGGDGNVKQGN